MSPLVRVMYSKIIIPSLDISFGSFEVIDLKGDNGCIEEPHFCRELEDFKNLIQIRKL
jgi:hypothetical protein